MLIVLLLYLSTPAWFLSSYVLSSITSVPNLSTYFLFFFMSSTI